VQFAIREAVATRSLDEILAARDTIDREVRTFVTERAGALGVEIGEIGVKDVILPGDVRELLNKVVEAERTAKANLIRRQEETAATRSLLNTARLMEDNPLLLRLKELEALEKLVAKVGRIDLHTGAGVAASMPCCRTATACGVRATRPSRLDACNEEEMPAKHLLFTPIVAWFAIGSGGWPPTTCPLHRPCTSHPVMRSCIRFRVCAPALRPIC
jgi:regulator of protease activity HflC (stomatin/prohibitin superfamily)